MTVLAFKKTSEETSEPAAIVIRRKSDNTIDMTLVEGGDPVVNDAITAFDVLVNIAGGIEEFLAKQCGEYTYTPDPDDPEETETEPVDVLVELIENRKTNPDWKEEIQGKKDNGKIKA